MPIFHIFGNLLKTGKSKNDYILHLLWVCTILQNLQIQSFKLTNNIFLSQFKQKYIINEVGIGLKFLAAYFFNFIPLRSEVGS